MSSPLRGSDSPTMIDEDGLATAVALASNALAEAMEVLAEVTEAISDAGLINGSDEYTRGLDNLASLFRTINLAGEKFAAPEITVDIVNSDTLDHADQIDGIDQQTVSQFEKKPSGESDAASSTSDHAVCPQSNLQNGSDSVLTTTHTQGEEFVNLSLDHEYTKPDSESETESNNKGWRDEAYQHVETDQRAQSTTGPSIFTPSPVPSVASDSTGETESTPLHPILGDYDAGSHPPQCETKGERLDAPDSLEPERGNEANASPETSVAPSPTNEYEPISNAPTVKGVISGPQPYEYVLEDVYTLMESYPTIPPGRNYIQLNHESDALAFIAYMALQSNRTICLLPYQLSVMCSELLKSLTRADIHRITTVREFQRISTAFRGISVADSYDILVASSGLLDFVSLHEIHLDCVLHWGQPPDANLFISRAVAYLPPTTKVCVMVGQQYFNGLAYAVAPYPNLVLATCVNPHSPFQLLRKLSFQLLSEYGQATGMQSRNSISNLPLDERGVTGLYSVKLHDALEAERNNKNDVSPQSLVISTSNDSELAPRPFKDDSLGASDPRSHASKPLENVESHPPIPPGRNYIHLDEPPAVLAFIAYMALRVERIICAVPDDCLELYSELFTSLTHATIHLLGVLEDGLAAADNIDPASCHIFFAPYNLSNLDAFVPILSPDCVLYFSPPASAFYYVVHTPLSPSVRSCVIVTEANDYNVESYGFDPYPDTVIDACFHEDSPFQLLFQVASQLLHETHDEDEPAHASGSHLYFPHANPLYDPDSNDFGDPEECTGPLPTGHYYIVLDKANNLDMISLIAHIVMNTSKAICYIPKDKSLSQYQRLINLMTGINAIVPSETKNKKYKIVKKRQIKSATKRLRSNEDGVLLRGIEKNWYSFLSSSLADSLIYCGVPSNMVRYKEECSTKVHTSYLVPTTSQYYGIRQYLYGNIWISQHPDIQASDSSRPGSALYNLRQGLAPHL
ncbi:hypothetical protein B0J17DRAFT_772454 [Rhizoctonia solani]|nr:hypothetical protein B0J17DRAFT_772454 [Rhizoctonia solani]